VNTLQGGEFSQHKENMNMTDSKNTENTPNDEFITPTELAKLAGVRPQVMYNLARQGYLKFEDVEVTKTVKMVSVAEAQRYLQGRKDRADRKAAKAQS
jgi:hypothetical protein